MAYFAGSSDYAATQSSPASFIIQTAVAPTLVSTQVGDGSIQRSTITSFTLVFSEPVNFSTASFTLFNTTGKNANTATWTAVSSSAYTVSNPSGDRMTWVITCKAGGSLDRTTGQSSTKGFFADGLYQVTLNAAAITDATGTDTLASDSFYSGSGAVKFTAGTGTTYNVFSVLYGDMAGNGQVNLTDYSKFKAGLGSSSNSSSPSVRAAYALAQPLDWFGNGQINLSDYAKFKSNLGKSYTL